jgi:hypothetical protein
MAITLLYIIVLYCFYDVGIEALGEHARTDNVHFTLPPHTDHTDTSHIDAGLIVLGLLNMITRNRIKDVIYY